MDIVKEGMKLVDLRGGLLFFVIICMIIIMDTEDSLDSAWSNKTTSNTSFFPAASAS